MQHRDRITIQKIIDEIDIGIKLLGTSSQEEFLENELLKRALGMTCINVGELVKVVSENIRQQYKEFPWKAVAGMRDITAHRYQTLRMEDVFITVRDEYPQLNRQLRSILEKEQENETI